MINISSCYDKNAYIGSEKMKIDNVSVGTDKTINNILENTRKKLKNWRKCLKTKMVILTLINTQSLKSSLK